MRLWIKGSQFQKCPKSIISHMRLVRGQISGDHGLHQGRPKQLNETEELDSSKCNNSVKNQVFFENFSPMSRYLFIFHDYS